MISSPSSLLLLFITFSLINPCALGWCETLFQCGNITAGYPFRGGNRGESCGHPLLELHCNKNITSLTISNQEFHVLHINQTSNTLRLARPDLLGPFCSSRFVSTPFLPEIFELTETYKSFTVYYFCDPRLHYLSSYTCPDNGLVSISQNPDYQNSCQNSFTFPVSETFDPKENLTNLETVLRKGFEVLLLIDKLPCQSCLSSQGICGFNGNKQVCCNVTSTSQVKCSPLYSSGLDDEVYKRCSAPFSCSNRIDLWYPYWIPGREECGHPDFKVNCSRGFPEVTIHSIKFRVLVASKWPRTRLARSDYISNLCTLDPLNVPFNGLALPYSPDTELLTLYYDCPSSSLDSLSFQYIGDLGCVNHQNSYYVTRNIASPLLNGERVENLKRFCKRNVSIPASGPALVTLQRSPTLDNLRAALEQGFELGRDQDCSRCEASLGVCGYSQISSGFICHCFNGSQGLTCTDYSPNIRHGFFDAPEIGPLVGVILFAFLVLSIPFVQRLIKARASENLRQKKLMANISLKQYSYAQAKRITNSFAEVIGRGGFGIVYQGTLSDGRKVAVKVLKDVNADGEDFINEVASMSKTSHVNIVSLLGFCLEGSKRAIIYEFVGNGSLDKFISGETTIDKDWKTLYGIALGVARGLEYLHHGCKMRIVHFDIKPHNVLLDDNLCPKISDFGLARLCEKKESVLSFCTRGTVGYIAPEMISRVYGNVSHKSDVYSYGMLVLEMIGARNKESAGQNSASNASSMYFPDWVYKDLENEKYRRLSDNGVTSEEEEIAKKMTLVGLWCIQSSPSDRPPMNRVVEMMEGNIDALEVPPKPVLHQIPAGPLMESSVEYSSTSEALTCSTSTN